MDSKNRYQGKRIERIKAEIADYDAREFFVTNEETKQFEGNSVQLLSAVYKAECLPLRVRLYAASKLVEYDRFSGADLPEQELSDDNLTEVLVQRIGALRREMSIADRVRATFDDEELSD